jgi:serine/threonine-protein kinase
MDLDTRSDIYSTGVMLCEMFCGKLPFSGGNTMELYVAHLQQPPIKPSLLWPDIPRALEEVILKCLEKKPADRYASATDLLVALSGLRA